MHTCVQRVLLLCCMLLFIEKFGIPASKLDNAITFSVEAGAFSICW